MGLSSWFKTRSGDGEYAKSAYDTLARLRKHCLKKYGDDQDILYEKVGKQLQY